MLWFGTNIELGLEKARLQRRGFVGMQYCLEREDGADKCVRFVVTTPDMIQACSMGVGYREAW